MLLVYSVDVYDYETETFSTQLGIGKDESSLFDGYDSERMKNHKVVGEISNRSIAFVAHNHCREELNEVQQYYPVS